MSGRPQTSQTAGCIIMMINRSSMGQTRNTAKDVDRGIARMMMRDHEPQTLTAAELDLEHEPITRPPRALRCDAWVRYGTMSTRVAAIATAWTSRAVAVKWKTPDDVEHRAWVWAPAVTFRA